MTKYETEMEMIMNSARFKMQLNEHKGAIEEVNAGVLSGRAKAEIDEMMQAFEKEEWDQVVVEAGDTMNFLIGIVSQAMTKYRAER